MLCLSPVVSLGDDSSAWVVEAGGSGVCGHPKLHSQPGLQDIEPSNKHTEAPPHPVSHTQPLKGKGLPKD